MVQIITSNSWWGWGGWASYTAGNWIDITNNEISIDTSVVAEKSDLSWYQTVSCMVCDLTWADNSHYPSAKAVSDALQCAWAWDMLKSVYDPNNVSADAFDYCNFINTPTIPTDNCQLANGCGYTTCTWTLTSSNISDTAYGSSWSWVTTIAPSKNAVYAKVNAIDSLISSNATASNKLMDKNYIDDSINSVTAYYITKNAQGDQWATYAELAAASTFYSWWVVRTPTRNDYTIVLDDENHDNATTRYIYNSGWEYQYTVNETAMTQAQLDAINSGITSAKVTCYDAIPVITNNCQIANGCGYTTCTWTLSSCADVISALWYTPYSSANPSWYTTCTGTVSTCADVISALWYTPYNNTNPNWYTTCTWTLVPSNIACINWCCLTNWWNITISWWITNDTTCTTSTIAKEWAWTSAEFSWITPSSSTIYFVF